MIDKETDPIQPGVFTEGIVVKRDAGSHRYYSITDDRIIDGVMIMREVLLDRYERERTLAAGR